MNIPNIKAIIFDLGNVLISFDHMLAARKIIGLTDKPIQEIYSLFFDSGLTEEFETGRMEPQEFFQRVKMALNLRVGYEDFLPIWNEIFFMTQQNHEIYSLANKLKKDYTTVLLSNINKLHFEHLKETFLVFDAFHRLYLSYELKLRKPDPLIYKYILNDLSLNPQDVVYVDDRPDLIQSAQALGIKSFTFQGVEKLKEDLRVSKILDKDNIL